jgi:glycosyltransferase involved in cell wall biosynthesis
LKIAYVIQNLGYGGAEMQLISIAEEQVRCGHCVLILTLRTPAPHFQKLVQSLGLRLESCALYSPFTLPATLLKVRNLLDEFDADFVHAHMYHANMLVRLIAPTLRAPKYICTAHNVREGGRFRDFMYALTDRLCDVTTNVSQAAVDRYNRDGLVRNNACILMENGVDTKKFQRNSSTRNAYRTGHEVDGNFVWLSIGSLTPQKDYPNLLRSFKQVVGTDTNVHLFVAGEGPERQALENLIVELDLSEVVSLLGNREDTVELYSMADSYVMSSAWEGLPIVLLEAMSCSLPCVVTDVGGNADLVRNDETGFVVPLDNSRQLAANMLRLMHLDPEQRKIMGIKGRRFVQSEHDLSLAAARWRDLYGSLSD